jgi:UDP-glucose 6-dehydrogenase
MKNICVVGTGYVGLVTGTCFADLGNRVIAVDVNEEKIASLKQGEMPIYEPSLKETVERNVGAGRLSFSMSYEEGLKEAEFVFICVGTPEGVDGEADLRYVRSAAETIAKTMDHPLIIINKSTVPVGTGDWVADIVRGTQPKPIDFSVVSCPEFLREGSALADFMKPDRTVLGSTDQHALEQVAQLFLSLRAPIVTTDLRTAEMIKYASNAFLATRISFINEISIICEQLGADVIEVAQGMGFDKRIGHHFLQPGVGYGGSCFLPEQPILLANNETETLESLFTSGGEPFKGDDVEVVTPSNLRVRAFDLDTANATPARVKALTRRPFKGVMVTLKTRAGRVLCVTSDHPVIVADGAADFKIIPAFMVSPGDELIRLDDPAIDTYTTQPVKSIDYEQVNTTVYSLETETGTIITPGNFVTHNCFPKDVKALAYMAQTHGMHPQLLHAVMDINSFQRKHVTLKLHEVLGEMKGKTVGLLGLAFKENTDDIRESPAISIAQHLIEQGATVRAYDPEAMEHSQRLLPTIQMCDDPYAVADDADALVIATPWNEFKQLDMVRVHKSMKNPVLIDGRNLYEPEKMTALGFTYRGVGRGFNGAGLMAEE